jgi:hypothetical protein
VALRQDHEKQVAAIIAAVLWLSLAAVCIAVGTGSCHP